MPYTIGSGEDVYAHLKKNGMFMATERTPGISTSGNRLNHLQIIPQNLNLSSFIFFLWKNWDFYDLKSSRELWKIMIFTFEGTLRGDTTDMNSTLALFMRPELKLKTEFQASKTESKIKLQV